MRMGRKHNPAEGFSRLLPQSDALHLLLELINQWIFLVEMQWGGICLSVTFSSGFSMPKAFNIIIAPSIDLMFASLAIAYFRPTLPNKFVDFLFCIIQPFPLLCQDELGCLRRRGGKVYRVGVDIHSKS